jgi:hypothetical protein
MRWPEHSRQELFLTSFFVCLKGCTDVGDAATRRLNVIVELYHGIRATDDCKMWPIGAHYENASFRAQSWVDVSTRVTCQVDRDARLPNAGRLVEE